MQTMSYRFLQKLLLAAGKTSLLLFCCHAGAATPYWITGGTLIDGTGAGPGPNPGIFINEGSIISVGEPDSLPDDAREINADGKWVLPGLFDLHAHITFKLAGARDLEDDVINALRSERFLERYQEIGVTVVRDVASRYHVGYSLKRAQRDGLIGGRQDLCVGSVDYHNGRSCHGISAADPADMGRGGGRSLGIPQTRA